MNDCSLRPFLLAKKLFASRALLRRNSRAVPCSELPPDLVARLELPFGMTRSYELGDGGRVAFDIHRTTVLWDGQERDVEAIVTNGGALVGMAMLSGYRLFVDVADGGEVLIEARQ